MPHSVSNIYVQDLNDLLDWLNAPIRKFYHEIVNLSEARGYCFASNKHFASKYQVTERTIRNWLKVLKDDGLIQVSLNTKNHHSNRRIYVNVFHKDAPPISADFPQNFPEISAINEEEERKDEMNEEKSSSPLTHREAKHTLKVLNEIFDSIFKLPEVERWRKLYTLEFISETAQYLHKRYSKNVSPRLLEAALRDNYVDMDYSDRMMRKAS